MAERPDDRPVPHGAGASPDESPGAPGNLSIPDVLPVLPLRDTVVFPLTAVPLGVGQPRSIRLVDDVMRANRLLALVAQRESKTEPAMPEDLYRVGTVGMIHQLARVPDTGVRLVVQGIERVRLIDWIQTEPYLVARIEVVRDDTTQTTEVEALRRAVLDIFHRLVEVSPELPGELAIAAESIPDPRHIGYLVASVVPLDSAARQGLLETDTVPARLRRLIDLLQRELAVRELGRKITSDTEEHLSKQQREFYLREQLRSIQRELGEGEGGGDQESGLRKRIDEAGLPDEARREADRELSRLSGIPPSSPEHGMIVTYLEWMAGLPWSKLGGGAIDIHHARRILDEDHYDLEKVKDRILEYLSVKKLRQERSGSMPQGAAAGVETIFPADAAASARAPASENPSFPEESSAPGGAHASAGSRSEGLRKDEDRSAMSSATGGGPSTPGEAKPPGAPQGAGGGGLSTPGDAKPPGAPQGAGDGGPSTPGEAKPPGAPHGGGQPAPGSPPSAGDTPVPARPPLVTGDTPAREPILCFVGPPGVGKTSLGQSISRALGRRFVRMSLGGVRDEAEIRGHRRTYIGAMPGRIIQGIRRAETRDPVFMLDEIDKIGADWRGDPSSALLEVLDPAQNNTFVDNYLGVPFDLSQVLFIATANTLDSIPGPLVDRMEVLWLSGYTDEEKVGIARNYLIPKQLAAHSLAMEELTFEEEALRRIVRGYTREAGVRNLEREIATVARKVARRLAEGLRDPVVVTADNLGTYLGRPHFIDEVAERTARPGVATGLAWTPTGGEVLFVEVAMIPGGGGRLLLTGMMGDVMRESAEAALSFVWSHAEDLEIDPRLFEGKTVHVHVPAGAIPKDGPSAGVAIMTAVASLATQRPVRNDVAMTGEITLRGKVLPVGGIREKVLAAHRVGIRSVILPALNDRSIEDVPDELRKQMHFILVEDGAEVLRHALVPVPAERPRAASE